MDSDETGHDQWNIDHQGLIRSFGNDLAWTQTGEHSVELAEHTATLAEHQRWRFKPYLVSPFTRENPLAQLLPEQPFFLECDQHPGFRWALTAAQAQWLPATDTEAQHGAWRYAQGKLIDTASGLALTSQSEQILLATPRDEDAHQQWYMSSDGCLIQPFNAKVLEFEDGQVRLMDYDLLRPAHAHWQIRHFRQRRASLAVFESQPLGYISKLSITVTIANVFWGGTSDKIMLTLTSLDKAVRLFDAPHAGDSVTLDIDIQAMFGKPSIDRKSVAMFGKPSIPMRDVHTILFYQESRAVSGGNDQWKLESIVLKANDRYLNDSLRSINRWVSPPFRSAHISWGSTISWCNWRLVQLAGHPPQPAHRLQRPDLPGDADALHRRPESLAQLRSVQHRTRRSSDLWSAHRRNPQDPGL